MTPFTAAAGRASRANASEFQGNYSDAFPFNYPHCFWEGSSSLILLVVAGFRPCCPIRKLTLELFLKFGESFGARRSGRASGTGLSDRGRAKWLGWGRCYKRSASG